MDLQSTSSSLKDPSQLNNLLRYIITTFFPAALPLVSANPNLLRAFGCVLVLWPMMLAIRRLKRIWDHTSSLLVSTVTISEDESLYDDLATWLRGKNMAFKLNYKERAGSVTQSKRPRSQSSDESAPVGSVEYVQLSPTYESALFFFRRRLYVIRAELDAKGENRMVLHSLSRSTKPQKDLLEEICRNQKEEEREETLIKVPWARDSTAWRSIAWKPVRPLETVVMEDSQKSEILSDVEEYIRPETKDMYVSRGIPYRRGYLFSGPPGTGKTSLAIAIAGYFDLTVYMVSLLDVQGDSVLIRLLQSLPDTGCLLLMEDIDSSGIGWRPQSQDDASAESETAAKAAERQQTSGITLSGLLNAIDGVSAPEGHVLVVTTNHPERLDSALIRSGRISVKVAFTNATQAQARDIFLRQYQTGELQAHKGSTLPKEAVQQSKKLPTTLSKQAIQQSKKLPTLATAFANKVQDGEFSPADLQDYLILHKDEPQRAVDHFDEFKTKAHEARALATKERENEREQEREAREKEATMLAETSASAMVKAMSAASNTLVGSKWSGVKFCG